MKFEADPFIVYLIAYLSKSISSMTARFGQIYSELEMFDEDLDKLNVTPEETLKVLEKLSDELFFLQEYLHNDIEIVSSIIKRVNDP